MSQPIYATVTDVATAAQQSGITDNVPEGASAERWIRLASRLVSQSTMAETYPTNPDGTPRDTDLAKMFRDATVEQVLFWASSGMDPMLGMAGVKGSGEVEESSIGSGRVRKTTANSQVIRGQIDSLRALVPAALLHLSGSGRVTVLW